MPTAFTCENCGTNSWNRQPSEFSLVMYPHIMRDGTYCPVCGFDFGFGSEGKDDAGPGGLIQTGAREGPSRYGEIERADAKKALKAAAALEKRDISTARKLLEEVVASAPSRYEYSYEDGGQYFIKCWDLGEFESYTEAVQSRRVPNRNAVWLQSAYPLAYYYLAFLDVEAGQFESAQSYLERSLELEPDATQSLFEMGIVFGELGQSERAIEFLDRALSSRPYMNSRLRAKVLRGKGIKLIDLGELNRAEESLGESLLYDPEDKLAHHELAYIDYLRSGGESLGAAAGVSRRKGTNKPTPQTTMAERLRKAGMVEVSLPPERSEQVKRATASGNEPEPRARKQWWKIWG